MDSATIMSMNNVNAPYAATSGDLRGVSVPASIVGSKKAETPV